VSVGTYDKVKDQEVDGGKDLGVIMRNKVDKHIEAGGISS